MNRKGNILLLTLFLLAFITSIIGLMYSYNKRILILNKEENANLVAYKNFTESLLNLYIVNNFSDGFNIDIFGISGIFENKYLGGNAGNLTFKWSESSSSSNLTVNSISLSESSIYINTNHGSQSEDISAYINSFKNNRGSYFNDSHKESLKNKTKNFLENIFKGDDKEIDLVEEKNPEIKPNKPTGYYILKYNLKIKKIKTKDKKIEKELNKEFEVEARYRVSIGFVTKARVTQSSYSCDGIYNSKTKSYDFSQDVGYNLDTWANVSAELEKIDIHQK